MRIDDTGCRALHLFLLLLLPGVCCISLHGQETEPYQGDGPAGAGGAHRIGPGGGYWLAQSRDEAGSPLSYGGPGVPITFSYMYQGEAGRHRLRLVYLKTGINAPELRARNSEEADVEGRPMINHTADYSYRGLQYAYTGHLSDMLGGRLGLYLGGAWDNILFFRYYTYGFRDPQEREPDLLTWEAISSFNMRLEADYRTGERGVIHFSLQSPFLAYVVRPRYAVQEDLLLKIDLDNFSKLNTGRGRFVSIGGIRQMEAGLGYEHELSESFAARLDYSFLYFRYPNPHPTAWTINSLWGAIFFKF